MLFLSNTYADNLEKFCAIKSGKIYTKYRCPKSRLLLPVKTCEYENEVGDIHFVNGCSGPTGGYGDVFFRSCLKHDLCYHHEPSSNGLNRNYCDSLFFVDTIDACDQDLDDLEERTKCKKWAKAMYRALRVVGTAAFHCADNPTDY